MMPGKVFSFYYFLPVLDDILLKSKFIFRYMCT